MERIYVAVDLEMTGLEVGEDEIIEIGAVKFRGHEVLETFNHLVKPKRSLPLKITRITGITDEVLAKAPSFSDIGTELVRFIKSYPIVGHSFHRDKEMLSKQGITLVQNVYDTFDLATLLLPHMSAYKLATLAEYFGVPYTEAHRALHDADVSRQIFLYFMERIKALDTHSLREVNRLMNKTDWQLRELFSDIYHDSSIGPLWARDTPSESVEEGVEEDNTKERNRISFWPEAEHSLKPTGIQVPIDLATISAFFSPEGAMSNVFQAYEQRPQQVEMALATTQSFNTGGILLVEAGTGTGKSMAYLVPSVMFAWQRGERVVVSTHTINLQDQLFFKDIPDLQQMMMQTTNGIEKPNEKEAATFQAALLKGRSNYLCLHRYKALRYSAELQPEEARLILKVHFWLSNTTSGDNSELVLVNGEDSAWSRINVPIDTCTSTRCAEFHNCFFFKARRKAEAAHVVVVNHALLLADIASQSQVLPPYTHLIIDEAHTLEDIATEQLGFDIGQAELLQFLDDLYQTGGTRTVSGLLSDVPTAFRKGSADEGYKEKVFRTSCDMQENLEATRRAVYNCFNELMTFMNQEIEHHTNDYAGERLYDIRLRIVPTTRQKPEWARVETAWDNLKTSLALICSDLGKLETLLIDVDQDDVENYDELLLRIQSLKRYATEIQIGIDDIIRGNEEKIIWLTLDRTADMLTLNAVPLDVSGILQTKLFAQKQTVILTSATLSINGTFQYMKDRLGLVDPQELQLDSPFDYRKQAFIYIPNDIPEPNQRGYQQKIEEALIQLCTATGGRTLALFTANSVLKKTHTAIQEALEEQNIIVLGQGIDGSRRNLLERFKEWSRTVLLGTSSFWQGVDVAGDALSVLVITKLPFSVPTDPIFAARSELFKDAFLEYAVPQSILRFKQGFGRLIRSKEDRGIVVVLDKRLLTKKYGLTFLQSLPDTTVREGPLKHLPVIATKFLGPAADV